MRTEEEILKDFELLGYKVTINKYCVKDPEFEIVCEKEETKIIIFKKYQKFAKFNFNEYHDRYSLFKLRSACDISLLEYKIMGELFECWGWL